MDVRTKDEIPFHPHEFVDIFSYCQLNSKFDIKLLFYPKNPASDAYHEAWDLF